MKKGDTLIIVADIYGHEFPIGSKVIIEDIYYPSYNCLTSLGIRHRTVTPDEYKIE